MLRESGCKNPCNAWLRQPGDQSGCTSAKPLRHNGFVKVGCSCRHFHFFLYTWVAQLCIFVNFLRQGFLYAFFVWLLRTGFHQSSKHKSLEAKGQGTKATSDAVLGQERCVLREYVARPFWLHFLSSNLEKKGRKILSPPHDKPAGPETMVLIFILVRPYD